MIIQDTIIIKLSDNLIWIEKGDKVTGNSILSIDLLPKELADALLAFSGRTIPGSAATGGG